MFKHIVLNSFDLSRVLHLAKIFHPIPSMSSVAHEKTDREQVQHMASEFSPSQPAGANLTSKEKTGESELLKPAAGQTPGTLTPSGASGIVSDSASAEKAAEPPLTQRSPRDVHGFLWVLTVLSILSTTFLFALDNTIVADVQPAIVARFGSIEKLPWLSVAFLVAAAGTNLVW